MKKQYIQPSMKAYAVKTTAVLNTVSYAGTNSAAGAPTTAEGKGNFDDDWE